MKMLLDCRSRSPREVVIDNEITLYNDDKMHVIHYLLKAEISKRCRKPAIYFQEMNFVFALPLSPF